MLFEPIATLLLSFLCCRKAIDSVCATLYTEIA